MAIPSEKYTLTKYNNTDVYFTEKFPVLYPNANDKFDNSIFYTSPEKNDYTFSNIFGSKTPVEIASTFEIPNATSSPTKYNQYKIKNETFNNPKLYFNVSDSTATGIVYYQTGMSEDDKTPRKSNADVAFAGNFNTKDIRFMPTITARKINDDGTLGNSETVSLNTLYENPDEYVILTFSSFRYYMRTDTGSVSLGAEPVITINDENIVGYTSLKRFIEEKTWSMQFGGAHTESGASGLLYKMADKNPYVMFNTPNVQIPDWDYNNHISESTVPPELLEYTTIAENDTWIVQGRWSVSYRNITEKPISGITYQMRANLKTKAFLKILAHLGIYLWSSTNFPNFDTIDDNVYIGYMNADGTTTGELLRGEDITNSDTKNKDYNTSNKDFDPDKRGGDDEDDPWDKINFGPGGGNLGVFAKFYLCTATDLANLRSWFGGGGHQQIPEGFDPMTQIIGLSQFATSVGGTAVDEAEITFRAADNTPVYTGVFCQRGSGADLTFDLGSIQIPLRMKERGVPFLDYSSTVELYIPFCGAFQLDPQTVLGRTVAVRMWMSTTTGECFAIATADGSPIAYGSGIMNAEMPISSSGWGVYKAALTNITDKYTGNIITEIGGIVRTAAEGAIAGAAVGSVVPGAGTAVGAGVGATAALIGGTANAAVQGAKVGHTIGAGLTEYNHLKKSSTTSISGSLSSTAAWHQPFTPYIKITRPHYQKPDNYAHTQAIPLVATKTLSDCAGLTMCVKTDLSGINATEYEKTVIASLLESGVIV